MKRLYIYILSCITLISSPISLALAASIDPSQAAVAQYAGSTSLLRVGDAHAGLGDVNGDGYDDAAIQVYLSSNRTGVLILYGQASQLAGGTTLTGATNTTLFTANSTTGFAGSIAGVGDVNNDGYNDILVGANRYSYIAGTTGGGAYLIYGGPALVGGSMTTTTDTYVVFASPNHNSYTGQTLAAAGDVNNDGNDDFIIGSPSYQTTAGAAYLVFGKEFNNYNLTSNQALLNNTNGEKLFEGTGIGQLGSMLSGVGDVDQDGCDDILLSAPYLRVDGINSRGASYLIYGGNDGVCDGTTSSNYAYIIDLYSNESFVAKFSGTALRTYTGLMTSGNGDVNGDGVSDFSIGAILYLGRTGTRYTSEYVGDSGIALGATTVFDPRIMSMSGDLNHDGYDDLLWFDHRSGENLDQITVVHGRSDINHAFVDDSSSQFEYAGAEGFVSNASFVGDLNQDGDDDFIISDGQSRAPFNDGYGWASVFYSVVDAPNLVGATTMSAECGVTFNDPGATAVDSYTGNTLMANAYPDTFNTSVLGPTVRSYTITNHLQRVSTAIERTIEVVDTTGPVITLSGNQTIQLTQGDTFTDPGATALDACDGTTNVGVTGTVNTQQEGSYVLTYSATDTLGNTSQTTRTVDVVTPDPIAPAPTSTTPPTTPDSEHATSPETELTQEELAELDVRDEATRDTLLDSIEAGKDGTITVRLGNGQIINIVVSPDDTGDGMIIELLSDTGAILVVTPRAKYVKLINPYTGEILDSYKMSKTGWKEKSLKLKDLRVDGLTDIILTTKKSPKAQIGVIRLNKPKLAFTKQAKQTVTQSALAVSKTKSKLNTVILRDKKGKSLMLFKLTKSYKLSSIQ